MDTYPSSAQSGIRQQNLSAVLVALQQHGTLSRTQLARLTHLNKSTITSLVADLLARGLVRETQTVSRPLGRPAMLLELNPTGGRIIGLQIDADTFSIAYADLGAQVFWREIRPISKDMKREDVLRSLQTIIHRAVQQAEKEKMPLLGLGVALPGLVDLENGVLIFAPNLMWRDVSLREYFSRHVDAPIYLDNDANAAALAEHLFGKAQHVNDFVFLFLGHGIGGGLFLRERIYRGAFGLAGEVGHLPIGDPENSESCFCGSKGCWETKASVRAVYRSIMERMNAGEGSVLRRWLDEEGGEINLSMIARAAKQGDELVLSVLRQTGEALGLGSAALASIFNPSLIVLGGPLSELSEYYLPVMTETMRAHTLPEISNNLRIEVSHFGQYASLSGAIALVVRGILLNPLTIERR